MASKQVGVIAGNESVLRKQQYEMWELQQVLQASEAFLTEHEEQAREVVDLPGSPTGEDGIPSYRRRTVNSNSTNEVDLRVGLLDDYDSGAMDKPEKVESGQVGFIAGVIKQGRAHSFHSTVWRACHGWVFLRTVEMAGEMKEPKSQEYVRKKVFFAFFQGAALDERVRRICKGMDAQIYPCPQNGFERMEMVRQVDGRLADLEQVLGGSDEHLIGRLRFA